MRKKVWINVGDIVLIATRGFQAGRSDVLGKYTADQARRLKAMGELPSSAPISSVSESKEADDAGGFDFEDL